MKNPEKQKTKQKQKQRQKANKQKRIEIIRTIVSTDNTEIELHFL